MGTMTTAEPSSIAASRSLEECEAVVERGQHTFIEVGQALAEIRDARLYLGSHPSFEGYLKSRWGMGRSWAYSLIDASSVASSIQSQSGVRSSGHGKSQGVRSNGHFLDATKAAKLAKVPEEKRLEVWGSVVEEAEKSGEPVTVAKVKAAVDKVVPPKPKPPKVEKPKLPEIPVVESRPMANGLRVSHKERKEAWKAFGIVARYLQKKGVYDQYFQALDQVAGEF